MYTTVIDLLALIGLVPVDCHLLLEAFQVNVSLFVEIGKEAEKQNMIYTVINKPTCKYSTTLTTTTNSTTATTTTIYNSLHVDSKHWTLNVMSGYIKKGQV